MKKFFTFFTIVSILFGNLFTGVYANEETYFVVTAYYSPLPNQQFYLKGNYEDELKLNGNGIRGASGKGVFSGMLAGPKNYAFGTKIELEGLGIGSIEDRGGAIVNAGKRGYEHDRIDVWMGYGDEGLKRALFWGKRTIKGKILSNNIQTNLDISKISAPDWATKGLSKIPNIFNISMGIGSNKENIKKLQSFFKEIGLYKGDIDGIYNNKIIDLVYDFQTKNEIVKSVYTLGAGYWGEKTRNLFLKKYLNGELNNKTEEIITKEITKSNNTEVKNNISIFDIVVDSKDEVIELQKILTQMRLYKGELSGNYKDLVDTIYDFQISKGLVKGVSSPGAGFYGPKTRTTLKQAYNEFLENEKTRLIFEEKINKLRELSVKQSEEKIKIIGTPKLGEVSPGVRELQKTLKILGYFDYKDTAIFGEITRQSLISYQLDRKIINSNNDLNAGLVCQNTKNYLKESIKYLTLKDLIKNEDQNTKNFAVENNIVVGNF